MTRYVKLISETEIADAPYEKDGVINYNCEANEPQLFADGYKIFIEIERPTTDRYYVIQYKETSDTEISEVVVWTETEEEYNARKLAEAKALKTAENTQKRNSIKAYKVNFSETETGYLLKSTPVGDINIVILGLVQLSLAKNMDIPAGSMRYYDADGNVHSSPVITKEFVPTFYQGYVTTISSIDAYSTSIEKQISEATTIEEVEAIIVDYETVGVM